MSGSPPKLVPVLPSVPIEAELIALPIVPHVIAEGVTPTVGADAPMAAVARLLADGAADAVAVVNTENGYLGLVGLRDVSRAVAEDALQAPVRQLMQARRDWLAPDDTPLDVLEMLRARGVEHLPVLDEERFVGIVSIGRLVHLLHRQFEALAMQRQRAIFGLTRD